MRIAIDKNKTINHYSYDDSELFEILRDSVLTLNHIYERLRDSDEFDDDECNRVYNIIDILWDMELE